MTFGEACGRIERQCGAVGILPLERFKMDNSMGFAALQLSAPEKRLSRLPHRAPMSIREAKGSRDPFIPLEKRNRSEETPNGEQAAVLGEATCGD